MDKNQASVSARISAFVRAYHATHDDPKIFDDFLADKLFTEEERAEFSRNLAMSLAFFDPERAATCPDQASALAGFMRAQSAPITLTRARYAEDSLGLAVEQGVKQYVILGAGLDTFAFRRPEMLRQLNVFELDYPATQAFKRERLAQLGWAIPPQLHMLPIDFNSESLATVLQKSTYDPKTPSFFSWLGVTYYLTREVVFGTLRSIAAIAPAGSAIIFDYLDDDAFVPERTARRVQLMQEATRRSGEPMKAGFDPRTFANELAQAGWALREDLGPEEIQARYLATRSDGYHAFEHVHLACAIVA